MKIPGMGKVTAKNLAHDRRRRRLLRQRAQGEEPIRLGKRKRRLKK